MKKTYVITGATSGIGKALTENLASKGHVIFAGYRNEEKIKDLPQGVIPFFIDSTKPETINSSVSFIKSKTDNINSIVNISGCVVAGAIEHIDTDEIRRQFEVNVFSHLTLTQGLLPLLEGGKIINISSMASFGMFPFISPYCASKRTLDILFNALQLETKHNIKVISIKPGVIATPLWEKSITENQKGFENCSEFTPEINFLVKNARKNGINGLPVEKVVQTILKADSARAPRESYTVGLDAKLAEIATHLPLSFVNKLIKYRLKLISKN